MSEEKEVKQENIYSSNDVSTLLKIQESTLRKYALMLEDNGYKFHKNEQGHRGYYDKDVIALKKLIELKKHPDMTLKQACIALMTWLSEKSKSNTDTIDIAQHERHGDGYNELLQKIDLLQKEQEKQQDFNKLLIDQLKKQQAHSDLNHQQLMDAIKVVNEQKQLIAATKEEKVSPEKKKKSWFKFWE
ncbi:MerR family transcriptional regulator [Peribacillus aracenensis]|uniref:MerR family transcriptional regulator n=1 Tax=Peribacillus aracenensis TaxID=2976708 RepID=UPI0021A5897F|nr:MerR family transcriptional regulator [Peribacillus sp. BBB004]